MTHVTDYPLLVFLLSFLVLWLSAWIGATFLRKRRQLEEGNREDFGVILAATLTLLGLIVGFSFSMAVNRYDQRKNLEEEEANAVGTEYVRAGLLPAADAATIRTLLKSYLEQRVAFYTVRDSEQNRQINVRTAQLQTELWSAVQAPAVAQPSPLTALAVTGMNDVLNSQGYTQAAWWNRIPIAAWALLMIISIFCNILVGYVAHGRSAFLFLILPIALSISLFLIADIDSPHYGIIRVAPQNLESLVESLHSQ